MAYQDVPVNYFDNGLTVKGPLTAQVMRKEAVTLAIVDNAVAVDLTRSSLFTLTLTGDITMSNPSGDVAGTEFTMVITQDGTGGRAITWASDYDWGPNGAPDFTNDDAAAVSVVQGVVVSSTMILMTAVRGTGASVQDVEVEDITAATMDVTGALTAGSADVTAALTAATVNGVEILTGTADPTAGGGVTHTLHALYFRNDSGTLTLWYATGAGATAWAAVDPLD